MWHCEMEGILPEIVDKSEAKFSDKVQTQHCSDSVCPSCQNLFLSTNMISGPEQNMSRCPSLGLTDSLDLPVSPVLHDYTTLSMQLYRNNLAKMQLSRCNNPIPVRILKIWEAYFLLIFTEYAWTYSHWAIFIGHICLWPDNTIPMHWVVFKTLRQVDCLHQTAPRRKQMWHI